MSETNLDPFDAAVQPTRRDPLSGVDTIRGKGGPRASNPAAMLRIRPATPVKRLVQALQATSHN
ncbi:MAG TPA: hypothetical protein VMN76_09440 [Acidobacteriota bacterium]|nr:hypothetical protein [Acidobacteriota bacterium]